MEESTNRRIIVIDDNEDIHTDFRKILAEGDVQPQGGGARSAFLGAQTTAAPQQAFDLADAYQGEQGVTMVQQARRNNNPFAMAFVDVRMPPGMDGVQTIERLWQIQPDLQVVICTAFADYSFEEIIEKLGAADSFLILKKPFEPVEVRQMASALTQKWNMRRQERKRMLQLGEAEREAREFALAQAETNRALEEANRAARAASRAKSNFLANMSHEIRTPMNAILGYLDLLVGSIDPDEEQSDYIQIVKQSGSHLLTIVDDVLDISRIEAGKLTVAKTSISPLELGREVVSICRTSAKDKGLELTFKEGEGVPEALLTDPNRLRQVLLNLIGNAIKFTEEGQVRLTVTVDRPEGGQEQIRFSVRDTGPGITEADLATIFDPFTQVDSSLTRREGGTGLGLAISQRLAYALGGEIHVESEPGRGSRFDLVIVLDETTAASPASGAPSTHLTPPVRKGVERLEASVLLVEDVPVNQLLIKTILAKAGSTVDVVSNGQEACETIAAAEARGERYDLVLMDMQMPVMDGYEASRTLRERGFRAPIVALTAHAMSTDRERCLEAGCSDYLTKPVDRALLLELCQRLLSEGTAPPLPSETETSEHPAEHGDAQ